MLILTGCAAPALAPDSAPVERAGATDASEPTDTEAGGVSESDRATQIVDDDVVCRYVKSTGSNIREKQCFTRGELAEMSAESREFLRTRGARGAAYKPPDPEDPRAGKKQ